MSDWFDNLDNHPSWETEEYECVVCGKPMEKEGYCSKECVKSDEL